jgi:hypothetical protein
MKTGSQAMIRFGDAVMQVLHRRPATGYLFPQIVGWKESDRAKAFIRRCRLVQVSGVSLHSYRYARAERAKTCGFPERFAQEALGHGSKAVARAYAKKAKVLVPSLEEYEQMNRGDKARLRKSVCQVEKDCRRVALEKTRFLRAPCQRQSADFKPVGIAESVKTRCTTSSAFHPRIKSVCVRSTTQRPFQSRNAMLLGDTSTM